MPRQLRSSPPDVDELEVSIFGPGRGESILVHVGDGRWITIDSCINRRDGTSPALEYLARLGVAVETQVVLVIATHAHDDHTAGISRIYAAAAAARLVTSAAFTSTEFFASVAADEDIEAQLNQSVRSEFRAVLDEARARAGRGERPIIRASARKDLLPADDMAWPNGPSLRVLALSPSETAVDRSHVAVASGAARVGERRRLSAPDPNEYSVAVWIDVGDVSLLFGGDLLTGPTGCGWLAIADEHHPENTASVFKVPHHGSENAHLEETWNDLVDTEAVSLLTPFRMGSRSIPRDEDVDRIVSRSGQTYITAKTQQPAASRDVKIARVALPSFAKNVREVDGLPGHVQARLAKGSGKWEIGLGEPALQIG
ncbi:hypothetical protein ACFDTO_20850 [Microbacteriaceae bacterium 4G12]